MNEREIKKRRKELAAEDADLKKQLDAIKRKKVIKCYWCGKGTQVSKLVLIQTHYYIEPYSCTGGDYWKQGEKQFNCPKCGKNNREWHFRGAKNDPFEKLVRYFKKTESTYDKR